MATALKEGAEILGESFVDNPLVRIHRGKSGGGTASEDGLLQSCLPNTFQARLAPDASRSAEEIAQSIEAAVHQEWGEITKTVHKFLNGNWESSSKSWDEGWDDQAHSFWDIRTAVLPSGTEIRDESPLSLPDTSDPEVTARELVGRAAAAQKMIRHFPKNGKDHDTRPKCMLTGADAQMGPIGRMDFWEDAADKIQDRGERLQAKDRFCAVSLIKRFAWAQYFSKRLGLEYTEKRSYDTATIAAASWIIGLRAHEKPIPDEHHYLHDWADQHSKTGRWSGQWLHWPTPEPPGKETSDEDPVPKPVWEKIKEAKKANNAGKPPIYYGALMLDGDNMGDHFRRASPKEFDQISGELQRFALELVPREIQKYLGGQNGIDLEQPVYAGGDDVLALLPLFASDGQTILDFAEKLNGAFSSLKMPESEDNPDLTTSAGLVIAHYKADLQDVLSAARAAEKAAKNAERNRLAIVAMRRSGEHSQAVLKWDKVPSLSSLVRAFRNDVLTDRWVYTLREEIDSEALSSPGMVDAEMARLISRSDKKPEDGHFIQKIWNKLVGEEKTLENQKNALRLIQTASFIARDREE